MARERRKDQIKEQVQAQQPIDAEARRMRLKNLIVLGKERGYLTYAEINDHLAYNAPQAGSYWVPDLIVECRAEFGSASDKLTLELNKAIDVTVEAASK